MAARVARDEHLPIRARDALVELLLESLACEDKTVHLEAAVRFLRGEEGAALSPRARAVLGGADLLANERGVPPPAWRETARRTLEAYGAVVAKAPHGEDLRVRLEQARSLFEAELYFEVHEVLEPAWIDAEGEPRMILQGLIQAAAGWYHWTRENRAGALSLLSGAADKLARSSDSWNDFPLAPVRRAIEEWRDWLAAGAGVVAPPLPFRGGDESPP